jgi:hypothetical protein
MHGYVALLGFGITRIRNHNNDASPMKKNAILVDRNDLKKLVNFILLVVFEGVPPLPGD